MKQFDEAWERVRLYFYETGNHGAVSSVDEVLKEYQAAKGDV